jgi:hypothetical protein
MTVGHNLPVPTSPRCCIWLSGPGFQDLDKRTLGFRTSTDARTLRTWVSGPRQTHALSGPGFQDLDGCTKALHPMVVDRCSVLCHMFFPSLFSTSSGHIQTHTHNLVTFLYVQWSQTHARTNKQLYI